MFTVRPYVLKSQSRFFGNLFHDRHVENLLYYSLGYILFMSRCNGNHNIFSSSFKYVLHQVDVSLAEIVTLLVSFYSTLKCSTNM